jgi:hypothetical protein
MYRGSSRAATSFKPPVNEVQIWKLRKRGIQISEEPFVLSN